LSYTSVESALLTVLRIHADWTSTNTSAGDFRILGKGLTKGLILTQGRIASREVIAAPRRVSTSWWVDINIFIPFKDEVSTVMSDLKTQRSNVIDHLDKYPSLNGGTGVIHAFVVSGGEPRIWEGNRKQRNWYVQILNFEITEHVTVTIAE
jgi:hypothetical protein